MQLGTTVPLPRDIDADLDRWLEPFLDATGRSTRRKMAPLYVRGLLGSGGRKSIQPMAERLGLSSHDQLHHFISSPAWDDAPLWRVLAEQVNREVGGEGAVLVVDDVGVAKKGELSVGNCSLPFPKDQAATGMMGLPASALVMACSAVRPCRRP